MAVGRQPVVVSSDGGAGVALRKAGHLSMTAGKAQRRRDQPAPVIAAFAMAGERTHPDRVGEDFFAGR